MNTNLNCKPFYAITKNEIVRVLMFNFKFDFSGKKNKKEMSH